MSGIPKNQMAEYYDLSNEDPYLHMIQYGKVIYDICREEPLHCAIIYDEGSLNHKPLYYSISYNSRFTHSPFEGFAQHLMSNSNEYYTDVYTDLLTALYDGPMTYNTYNTEPFILTKKEARDIIFEAAGVGDADIPEGTHVSIHRDTYTDSIYSIVRKAERESVAQIFQGLRELGKEDSEWLKN